MEMSNSKVDLAVTDAIRHIGIGTSSYWKVVDYLTGSGYDRDLSVKAADKLVERKYIDDVRAGHKVLRTRVGKKQESRSYIYMRLLSAGLKQENASVLSDSLPSDDETCYQLFCAFSDDALALPEEKREDFFKKTGKKRGYSYESIMSAYSRWLST